MQHQLSRHIQVAIVLLLLATAVGVGAWVAHRNQKNAADTLMQYIEKIEVRMFELAELTDRNGVDRATEDILSDCPRRGEYETLLNNLGKLSQKELIAVQGLFESCGSYYAERKAVMVSKLDREFEAYAAYIDLLLLLGNTDAYSAERKEWEDLIALEKKRSTLLRDQKEIQSDIIARLISGSSVQSKEVMQNVQEAQEIAELLAADDQHIDVLRGEIRP